MCWKCDCRIEGSVGGMYGGWKLVRSCGCGRGGCGGEGGERWIMLNGCV